MSKSFYPFLCLKHNSYKLKQFLNCLNDSILRTFQNKTFEIKGKYTGLEILNRNWKKIEWYHSISFNFFFNSVKLH